MREVEHNTSTRKHKSKKRCRTDEMGDSLAAWAEASKAKAETYRKIVNKEDYYSYQVCEYR